ncbi:MAG: bifunctional diguanylate cyclase/phosphohydrolase [Gaiellaceae bacterium]
MEKALLLRRVVTASAVGVAWLACYAAVLALRPGGERGLLVFSDTVYLVPIALAAVLAAVAAGRAARGLQVFWALVSVSVAIWLAAEILWSVRELSTGSVPFPWWTDVLYLASFTVMPIALLIAFRPSLRLVGRATLLDALLLTGGLALLWWWVVLRPLPITGDVAALAVIAPPVVGLFALGILVSTRLLPARQGTMALKVAGHGLAVATIDAGIYARTIVAGGYSSGAWLDLGSQSQAVLVALAAYIAIRGLDRRSDWARSRKPASAGAGALVAGVFSILAGVLLAARSSNRISTALIAVAVALGVLVVLRAWVAVAPTRRASATDPETGAFRPEWFQQRLRHLAGGARTYGDPFAVALVELDGDRRAGVEVARRLVDQAGPGGAVARLSDARLAVLLPSVEAAEALARAELLRGGIASHPVGTPPVTVSVGVATWERTRGIEALLEAAEDALETAHRLGGNQIWAARPGSDAAFDQLVALVGEVDAREGDDPDHSRTIASLSRDLAVALDLDPEAVGRTYFAGLLHDVGKVSVPEWVLRKPSGLTNDEWATVARHPLKGAALLARVDELRDAASVVANHHERWDGRGYPGGLAGHRIPVEARIIAVADSLVSMTAERPYRPAMSVTGALTDIWRRSGRSYDPAVVSALFGFAREGRLPTPPAAVAAASTLYEVPV